MIKCQYACALWIFSLISLLLVNLDFYLHNYMQNLERFSARQLTLFLFNFILNIEKILATRAIYKVPLRFSLVSV